MDLTERLQEQAEAILDSGDPAGLAEAAGLLKTLSDIEQQRANALKLDADRRKAEQDLLNARSHYKDLLATTTPLFTTAILAGTLVSRSTRLTAQTLRSAKRQRGRTRLLNRHDSPRL